MSTEVTSHPEGVDALFGKTVVLDARWIFDDLSGIGVYTRELIRTMPALAPDCRFRLWFGDTARLASTRDATGFDQQPNVSAEVVSEGLFSLTGQLRLPGKLRADSVDLFHSPNYMIPLRAFPRGRRGDVACVTTVHDLIPLKLPDHAPRSKKSRLMPLYRRLMSEVARRSDRVITVSGCSRTDAIELLGVPADRSRDVVVVYNGVNPLLGPAAEEIRHSAEVLYVGRFDPYKQVPQLVQAVAQLRERIPDIRLRLIGKSDERYPETAAAIAATGLSDVVTWDSGLSDAALADAYRRATVLVLPSLYEGFGLPVVEAMACGTPVACSTGGSLGEVAGDAAETWSPGDSSAMEEAIGRVLTDASLRQSLAERGRARAADFTWENTAAETLAVYTSALRA